MTTQTDRDRIHELARAAIDDDTLTELVEVAAGDEADSDAVRALREVTADELVANAVTAVERARRRGRTVTGDDVGDAAAERRDCCCPPARPRPRDPLYAEFEGS